MLSRKGMRQPHDKKTAAGMIEVASAKTPYAVTRPSGKPICTRLP